MKQQEARTLHGRALVHKQDPAFFLSVPARNQEFEEENKKEERTATTC